MKKFSALLVAITLVTMVFASAAFAADTYVFSDIYGKAGFLKVSGDKLVTTSTDNKGFSAQGLGSEIRLFSNSKDHGTAIAGGSGAYVSVKAGATNSADVVNSGTKTTASVGQITSVNRSGDKAYAVVGASGLYVTNGTTAGTFTSSDTTLKAAVPQVGPVSAMAKVNTAVTALQDAIASMQATGEAVPIDLGTILAALTNVTASSNKAANATALVTLLSSVAANFPDALAVNSDGAISLVKRSTSKTTTPYMTNDISTYSPVKKLLTVAPLNGTYYLGGQSGVKTVEAGVTLASYYAALKDASDAVGGTTILSDLGKFVADAKALGEINTTVVTNASHYALTTSYKSNLAGLFGTLMTLDQIIKDSTILGTLGGAAAVATTATPTTAPVGHASLATAFAGAGTFANGTAAAAPTTDITDAVVGLRSAANGAAVLAPLAQKLDDAINAYIADGESAEVQTALRTAATAMQAALTAVDLAANYTILTKAATTLNVLTTTSINTAETDIKTGAKASSLEAALQHYISVKQAAGRKLLSTAGETATDAQLASAVKTALGAEVAAVAAYTALNGAVNAAVANPINSNTLADALKYQDAALAIFNDLNTDTALATALSNQQTAAIQLDDISALATAGANAALVAKAQVTSHSTAATALAKALQDLADGLTEVASQSATLIPNITASAIAGDEVNGRLFAWDSTGKKVYMWDGSKTAVVTSDDMPTFSPLRDVEMTANGDYVMFVDGKSLRVYKSTTADPSLDLVVEKNDVVAVARLDTSDAAFSGGSEPDEPVTPPTPETPTVSLLEPSSLGDAGTKIVSAFSGAAATDFLTAAADVTSGDGTAANAAVKEAIEAKLQKEDDETVTTTAIKSFTFAKKGYILLSGSDIENVTLAETKTEVTARKFFFADEAGNVIEPKAFDENGNEVTTGSAKYLAAGEFPAGSTYTLYSAEKTKTTDDGGSGGSGGGCNAGFAGIAALAALALIKKSK